MSSQAGSPAHPLTKTLFNFWLCLRGIDRNSTDTNSKIDKESKIQFITEESFYVCNSSLAIKIPQMGMH